MVDRGRPEYGRLQCTLRQLREERGISQVEMARRLGTFQEWVSRYERGERRLDIIELVDILHALEVPLLDFFKRADIPHD